MREKLKLLERLHPILFCLIIASPVILLPALWLGFIIFHANAHHTYEFLFPSDQIACIQFVHMSTETDLYQYPVDEIAFMLDDRQTLCMELDAQSHDAFLADFSEVPCHKWVNDPCPVIRGSAILITYKDGSREWISSYGTFYHNCTSSKSSMTWYNFDQEAFAFLMSRYGC